MYFETQLLGWPYAMLSDPADWMADPEGSGRSDRLTAGGGSTDVTDLVSQRAIAPQEV